MKKKIALISTDWAENEYRRINKKYGGVSYYRLIKPMEILKKEYDVTFFAGGLAEHSKGKAFDEFYSDFVSQYDMIIVKAVDNPLAAQALIHWCKHHGTILVQDFDDNMLVIREDQPAHKLGYNPQGQRRAYCASMMSLSDALIVSTQPLKDYFNKFLKDVFNEEKDIYVYPNFNDVNDWNYPLTEKDPNKIVIGWMGSVTHDSDLLMVMPALGKMVEKYPNVYVELLGGIMQGNLAYLSKSWSKEAKKKLKVVYGTPAWDKYPELMRSQAWDIGIAPLIDDEFNRAKSHIKWMEYAMCDIPCIASDVFPYSKNIDHKNTGLLAKDDEWEENLTLLIENVEERKRLATNAREFIEKNLQWKQHEEEYLRIIKAIFANMV